MDWLRKLVAKYPSVKDSQFLQTFDRTTARNLYMSPGHCLGTAKALLKTSLKDVVLTADQVGFDTSDTSILYEKVLKHAKWFRKAALEGGCRIWS